MKRIKDKQGKFVSKLKPHHEAEIAQMLADQLDINQIIARTMLLTGCSPKSAYTYIHKVGNKLEKSIKKTDS